MIFTIAVFIVALIFLVKFSSVAINSSIKLSKLTGLSAMAVGFVLLAVVTSLPELAIGVTSSLKKEGLLSVGNILGSNIADIALVIGVIGLMKTIRIRKIDLKEIVKAVSITSLISLPLMFLNQIWWAFGLLCIVGFIFYSRSVIKEESMRIKVYLRVKGLKTVETIKTLFITLFSIAAVIISSNFLTDSAVDIASLLGISKSLVGATAIALGTSLPELALSMAAIRKNNIGLAIGNVVGSIIMNMTLVLGITTLIYPIVLGVITRASVITLLVVNMLFLIMSSRMVFGRIQGAILVSVYIMFLILLVSLQAFNV